jgi:deoxycytidylate deaminase
MIINAGIVEVVYEEDYHFGEQAQALYAEAGVICRQFSFPA